MKPTYFAIALGHIVTAPAPGVVTTNARIVAKVDTSEAAAAALVKQANLAHELLASLQALFDNYKALADSGDAGNWSLEDLDVGKQALAAIAKATESS